MKKPFIALAALAALSACQTTSDGRLRDGDVYGTAIGTTLSQEVGTRLSISEEATMNSEIEKALFFSKNGLTTRWYVGHNVRLRPLRSEENRRDRECRRFRHGHQIEGEWYNGTAVACREYNVAWYLIANEWDRLPERANRPRIDRDRNRDRWRDDKPAKGRWENLSGTLSGRPATDDFSDQTW